MQKRQPDHDRQLLRAANAVVDHLGQYRLYQRVDAFSRLRVLTDGLNELATIGHRFQVANDRSLVCACGRLLGQAQRQGRFLTGQVAEAQRTLDECDRARTPTLREVLAELHQIEDEFAQPLRFDRAAGTLSLATEPIELEGLYLGAFDIKLDVRELARMRQNHIYQIVALDPHPAGGADHVPHPHVSHETLCEGDASMAIRSSLLDGRIWDFYCLINGVLTSYNEESPYVRIDEWHGVTCYDCGERMDPDDLYTCEHCEERFCSDCYTWCRVCDRDGCFGCLHRCNACNNLVCGGCLEACDSCGEAVCTNCLIGCHQCSEHVCDACVKACDHCDRVLCENCAGDGTCNECAKCPDRAAQAADASEAAG